MRKTTKNEDTQHSDAHLIIRRAKVTQKVRCKCGAQMPKEDVACSRCYENDLRSSFGMSPATPRYQMTSSFGKAIV